jgi:hypothetical protein
MVVDVVDVPQISGYREVIDSKAMRRVRPDTEIQVVYEQSTVLTASAVNIAVAGRILVGN